MSVPTPVRPAPPVTVTVAVLGATAPPSTALCAALDAAPGRAVAWRVLAGEAATGVAAVDIVVCGDYEAAAAGIRRWPAAVVIALVPRPAAEPHAVLYLPDGDIGRVAAYVRALARRRGPATAEPGR